MNKKQNKTKGNKKTKKPQTPQKKILVSFQSVLILGVIDQGPGISEAMCVYNYASGVCMESFVI